MAMENILVAYDGSDSSLKALGIVADIVKGNPDVNIDVANVVSIPLLSEDQAFRIFLGAGNDGKRRRRPVGRSTGKA